MAQLFDYISFKPTLVEASSDGKKVVEGRFSLVDTKNANGRIYSRSLWEKVLNSHNTLQAIEERRMYGELDHPMDGKLLLSRASHIITKLWINESGEVCGRAEILSTPSGKIVEAILSAGGMIGISSRASGTTSKTALGEMVNEADFKLETFDFVANPSTPGAYPKLLSESEDITIEENLMTALEKFKLLEQRASTVLGIETKSLDQNARSLTEDATANVIIELTKLLTESPELKDIGKVLIKDLQDKRKALRKPLTEEVSVAQGSADQGFMRPPAPQPTPEETNTPGSGWPINPGDEGILAGINNGVNAWAEQQMQEDITESDDEDEDDEDSDDESDKKKKKKKGKNPFAKEGDDDKEEMKEGLLSSIANELVQLEETASNKPLRAFAAAYLLERTKRLEEASSFTQIIGKLQGKYKELVESGKVIIEGADEELKEKYSVSLQIIEELRNRHRALSAKVYAEAELEKIGLQKDENARKKISEAIKASPTKEAIDEAIAFLTPVKGLKPTPVVKADITESTLSITKKDSAISSRTESAKIKQLTENTMYGAAYALQLAGRLNSPRAKK